MMRSSQLVLLGRSAGRAVGFARVISDRVFRAFVEDVIVIESARGDGVGQAIMLEVERIVHQWGVPRLELVTQQPGFWKKLGYVEKEGSNYMVKSINGGEE